MTSTLVTDRTGAMSHPASPRWRLGRGWRRATLVLHIVSAGAWIGIDVVVAVLVFTGWFSGDPETRSTAYRALATFVVWPMFAAGLASLLTGVVLGLASKWGLVRFWWVAVKLALNLALCALVLVALQPGMEEVAAYGDDLLAGDPDSARVSTLFFPPVVSLTALTLATWLAVFKPWGRIRGTRRTEGGSGPPQSRPVA